MKETVGGAPVQSLVEAIAGPGWGILPGFISPEIVSGLVADIERRDRDRQFRPAAVGAGAQRAVRPSVRGDRICWFTATESAAENTALDRLEELKGAFNEALTLGLAELECHYAIYDPGARYARHLDKSPKGVERTVSVILYLNKEWSHHDGGELVITTPAGEVTVLPEAGTLVAFLSERFEHEVRIAFRTRMSLTGWFRRRPLTGLPV